MQEAACKPLMSMMIMSAGAVVDPFWGGFRERAGCREKGEPSENVGRFLRLYDSTKYITPEQCKPGTHKTVHKSVSVTMNVIICNW